MNPRTLYLVLPVTAKTLDSISTVIGMSMGFGEKNPLFQTFSVPIAHLASFALFMFLIALAYLARLAFGNQCDGTIVADTIAVLLTGSTFIVVAWNLFLVCSECFI